MSEDLSKLFQRHTLEHAHWHLVDVTHRGSLAPREEEEATRARRCWDIQEVIPTVSIPLPVLLVIQLSPGPWQLHALSHR